MKIYLKTYSFWIRTKGETKYQLTNYTATSKKIVIQYCKDNGYEIENGLKGIKQLEILNYTNFIA